MEKFFVRKCPFCSGDMLRAKPTSPVIYTPPWAGILKIGVARNRAFPWACMGCGVVLFYLDRVHVLSAEYKRAERGQTELSGAGADAI